MPTESDQFDPLPLLGLLADTGVDFVVIGGVAGGAHGSSYPTYDLDIAYERSRENIEKIIKVLREVNAKLRGGAPVDVAFQLDAKTIENGSHFTFVTDYGAFDLHSDPDGAPRYPTLRKAAARREVNGRLIHFASLDHLIAMKYGSERTKDKLMGTEYRVLADEIRCRGD